MITLKVNMENLTTYEFITVDYAVLSYGFVIEDPKAELTPTEFANEIAKVYDETEPHTAEVIRVLKSVEGK